MFTRNNSRCRALIDISAAIDIYKKLGPFALKLRRVQVEVSGVFICVYLTTDWKSGEDRRLANWLSVEE